MLHNKIIILTVSLLFEPCYKCLSTVPTQQQDKSLQVEISNGILQGKRIVANFKNVSYYAFTGIPYAQPPTGDLRFRPPRPALNWSSILDAGKVGSACGQFAAESNDGQLSEGSEDCLFINVYTPYTEKQRGNRSLLPIIFWIHGGAFMFGNSNFTSWRPDYLIQHDVVVVTLNYRLGVFGFLSTGDMASPGNYGLKDQLEGLKWVQRNIQHFGGNPSQVTISGSSAGAASVHYLLQTPLANGLYHGAISESGSTLCNWALTNEPRKIAFKVAALVGVVATDTEQLITKLRSVEFDTLNEAMAITVMELITTGYEEGLPFSPSIEPEHNGAVISKGSYALLSSNQFNKVPLLTGFNSQEVASFAQRIGMVKFLLSTKYASPDTIVHKNINITNFTTKVEVGRSIRSFYLGNELAFNVSDENLISFFSDDMFVRPIYKTVKLYSHSVPVYFYRFSYESADLHPAKKRIVKGVQHSEELNYIFYSQPQSLIKSNMFMVSKIVKMWTNFVKTGDNEPVAARGIVQGHHMKSNPTPTPESLLDNVTWPVANEKYNLSVTDTTQKNSDIRFLDIDDRLVPKVNPREREMKFWDDIYQKYPPVNTY